MENGAEKMSSEDGVVMRGASQPSTLRPDGKVLIIGAGEAGMAAAAALREGGFAGYVTLVSDEHGLPYARPPLSKEHLKADAVADSLIRPAGWFVDARVDLVDGVRVVGIDADARVARLSNGDGLHYDALVLATGAQVRRIADAPQGVHYLRTRDDALALRAGLVRARSLVVIGGGVIGLEVASAANELRLEVTVVDPAPRLMQRALAPDLSAVLAERHRAAGTTLMLGTEHIELGSLGDGRVRIDVDGTILEPDLCVAGIGVIPNDALARSVGCVVDNGVVVDGCGRTSVPHVYAAGDVAAFHHPLFGHAMRIEAWQHAGRHGAHVGRALLGIDDAYSEVPWFWTDQLGLNIQCAGIAADCDTTVWRGSREVGTAFHVRRGVLRSVSTVNNGREMRPSIKLLAAGWAGDVDVLADMSRPLGKIVADQLSVLQLA